MMMADMEMMKMIMKGKVIIKPTKTKRLFSQAALDMVPCLFKTPPEQKPG